MWCIDVYSAAPHTVIGPSCCPCGESSQHPPHGKLMSSSEPTTWTMLRLSRVGARVFALAVMLLVASLLSLSLIKGQWSLQPPDQQANHGSPQQEEVLPPATPNPSPEQLLEDVNANFQRLHDTTLIFNSAYHDLAAGMVNESRIHAHIAEPGVALVRWEREDVLPSDARIVVSDGHTVWLKDAHTRRFARRCVRDKRRAPSPWVLLGLMNWVSEYDVMFGPSHSSDHPTLLLEMGTVQVVLVLEPQTHRLLKMTHEDHYGNTHTLELVSSVSNPALDAARFRADLLPDHEGYEIERDCP